MKAVIKALGVGLLLVGFVAQGATDAKKKAESAKEMKEESKTAVGKKKSTDVSFEDVLVQGKYHFSDEAVTTVEQDKVLDSLLGVRKDFKDRIRKSVSQQ